MIPDIGMGWHFKNHEDWLLKRISDKEAVSKGKKIIPNTFWSKDEFGCYHCVSNDSDNVVLDILIIGDK
jgi:hypothetical protein